MKTYVWILGYISLGVLMTYQGIVQYWLAFITLTALIITIQQYQINKNHMSPNVETNNDILNKCTRELAELSSISEDNIEQQIKNIRFKLDKFPEFECDHRSALDVIETIYAKYKSKAISIDLTRRLFKQTFISYFNEWKQ